MNNYYASTATSRAVLEQGPAATGKPSKAAMFARLQRLKTQTVVGTVAVFLGVSALAATHQVGSAASPSTALNVTSSSSDDGGFFSQGGSDNQQGYSFQQGTSSQAPVSGTGVS